MMVEQEVTRRPSPGFKRLQRSTQTRSPIPTESTRFTLASTNLCPLLHSWSAVNTWLIGDDPTCVKSSYGKENTTDLQKTETKSCVAEKDKRRSKSREEEEEDEEEEEEQQLQKQKKNKTGTDISRIVFGIAAASETWIKGRREYVKLWWKPENKMRGYVWLEKEITEGTWGEEYPPFQVSEDTSNFEYTNSWGGRDALRISRIVSETFRLGLPDVDWFVMGDDDTVFFTENLVQVLSKYDHTKPFYVGYASESHRENIIFSFEMAFGGAGYAISYPLAKELANIQDSCIRRYPHFFGGDDRMYACMAELGVPLTKEPGFHQLDIRRDAMGILAAHPVAPLVSVHHLDFIPEIYPKTTTKSFSQIEAVKYLLDAAAVDPGSILQQSICYDRNQDWSISVSWGYVVEVYKGFISPLELQRPARTFLSWYHENEAGTFSLNVREIAAEVCQRPTRFFLEDIQGPQAELDGLMEGVYLKLEDPEQSECGEKLMPLSVVKTVRVLKEPLDPSWYQSPQRSCCRIEDWKRDKIDIHVGACREGESLLGAD
ncbi:unnamed protein product [Sphagnum jensenii]|uniref:Uncharacterized protein n=1 Tax=Sphagnum jensenii TaxID=128206 RepID=A0ABP0WUC9_9BRYO